MPASNDRQSSPSPAKSSRLSPELVPPSPSPTLPDPSPGQPGPRKMAAFSVDLGMLHKQNHSGQGGLDDLQRSGSDAEPAARGRIGLRSLDLQALPREDDGPPSELQARRQKFAQFENHCSEVAPGLCVGGGAVAKDRETLRAAGVTHVVNCVGMLVPNCFPEDLTYLTLFLQDTPGEDLTSVLYTVFDFIEGARQGGGCVLVHCSQGVSRSAALTIGYLMWKLGQPYDEVYQTVKAIRGVANPNIGFTCQLLQWQKRRLTASPAARLLRVAPAAADTPTMLVPKHVTIVSAASLDPRGAFVVAMPQRTYIWKGSRCTESMAAAARAAADALHRFEGAAAPSVVASEGQEPPELAKALRLPQDFVAQPCAAYDADFKVAAQTSPTRVPPPALAASAVVSQPRPMTGLRLGSSALSQVEGASPRGSKTPRNTDGLNGSPNNRRRKSARAEINRPVSPGRPSQDSLVLSSSEEDDDFDSDLDDSDNDSDASDGSNESSSSDVDA